MKKLQRQFFRTEASLWTLLLTVQRQLQKMESSKGKEYDLILMDIQMPGMNGHIAKPIEIPRLMEMLANLLESV